MARVVILTESELRDCVALDADAVAAVEQAFAALAGDGVVMPPILSMAIEGANGEVDVKTAYVPGLDGFAIKVSPGFFDNPKLGLPSLNGLMVLFSATTGLVQAVLLDNGYLTDVRTAAAGAVAAKHLAPADPEAVGVLGAGVQAGLQLRALALVRPVPRVVVWARDAAKAAAFAARMGDEFGCPVDVASSPQACVAASDIPGDHDARAGAAGRGGLAPAWPAHHGHGLRRRGEERTRARSSASRGPLRLRPAEPVRDGG